jgi:hypothetical protein
VHHEGDGADRGTEEVPPALLGEDLDLGVRGREREDHPTEGHGEVRRPHQVGLAERTAPGAQVHQRAAGRQGAGQQQDDGSDRDRADRREPPATVLDERDEQLSPGQVGQQLGRWLEHQAPRGHRDQQQEDAEPVEVVSTPARRWRSSLLHHRG